MDQQEFEKWQMRMNQLEARLRESIAYAERLSNLPQPAEAAEALSNHLNRLKQHLADFTEFKLR